MEPGSPDFPPFFPPKRDADWEYLVECATVPAFLVDVHSLRILAASAPAIELYGYSKEEFLRLTILDIRPAEDVARALRTVAHLHAPGGSIGRWRHRRRDGTVFEVDLTVYVVEYKGQEAHCAVVNAINGEPVKGRNKIL